MKLRSFLFVSFCAVVPAFGWGADGHRMVSEAAMQALPKTVPAFLRSKAAVQEVTYLAPEPDKQKGAGKTRDLAMSPGHYLDAGDDGRIFGGPKLSALPDTLADYDTALRKTGHTQYSAGYLPYAIVMGYQLVKQDFAAWRMARAGMRFAKDAAGKRQFAAALKYRQAILIHDIGVWSHFVGDGSMPLHVTVHFNGWGHYPNPARFTQKPVHVPWETAFVHAHVTPAMVKAAMPGRVAIRGSVWPETESYLKGTNAAVVPFYRLEKTGAFVQDKPKQSGVDFTAAQLGRGAGMLRDMIVQAWRASAHAHYGWQKIQISDVEAGKVKPILP